MLAPRLLRWRAWRHFMKKERMTLLVHPDQVAHKPTRKSKIGLPPRGPHCRVLPNIGIDFESSEVVEFLVESGMDRSGDSCQSLNEWIRPLVAFYCSDRAIARDPRNHVTQKQLCAAASRLDRSIAGVIRLLSEDAEALAVNFALLEALRVELDKMDVEEAPDPQFVRTGLEALQEAAQRVRDAEAGAGRPIDRAALDLVHGLAVIFKECTGGISASIGGRFAKFVEIINGMLPEDFQFIGANGEVDALIANAVTLVYPDTA
jgi:hypothetical protein